MELLIIRHAIAEDQDAWAQTGGDDDSRPLTADGRRKMTRGARGLHTVVRSIDLLAASELVRAQQTADIVATQYHIRQVETTPALRPDATLDPLAEWLAARAELDVVAVIGHEPHLSRAATWLLTGAEDSHIELKKGAACLIHFDEAPNAGQGRLLWSLAPAQLRQLADS